MTNFTPRVVTSPRPATLTVLSGLNIRAIRRALVEGGAMASVFDLMESVEFVRIEGHQAIYRANIDDTWRTITVRVHSDVADNHFFAAYLAERADD